jgi:hypothetical protein
MNRRVPLRKKSLTSTGSVMEYFDGASGLFSLDIIKDFM